MAFLKTLLVAALVLPLTSALARAGDVETRCFDTDCLDDAECATYTALGASVSEGIRMCTTTESCVARVVASLELIDEHTDLPEAAQFSLRSDLEERLAARFPVESPIILALLDRPGAARRAALSAVAMANPRAATDRVSVRLIELLRDDKTSVRDRLSILSIFLGNHRFSAVEADALALAADASGFELARGASAVYVSSLIDNHRVDLLRRLALSGNSVLAEMAAELVLSSRLEPSDSASFPRMVSLVAALAESKTAPPDARGEAIEALVSYDTDATVVPVLLRLLSPPDWFFGATGQHFPVHSLDKLIVALHDSSNDQIQAALGRLPGLVGSIPEEDGRDYVEWEIDNWILQRR